MKKMEAVFQSRPRGQLKVNNQNICIVSTLQLLLLEIMVEIRGKYICFFSRQKKIMCPAFP